MPLASDIPTGLVRDMGEGGNEQRPATALGRHATLGPHHARDRARTVRMNELITFVREGLDVFCVPDEGLTEIRILKTPRKTVSGYFDTLDGAAAAVQEAIETYPSGMFYVTLNPVVRAVHARAANRLKPYADELTKDLEISRQAFSCSSTATRRDRRGSPARTPNSPNALGVREQVVAWLTKHGWPAPLRAMSGNGGHADKFDHLPERRHIARPDQGVPGHAAPAILRRRPSTSIRSCLTLPGSAKSTGRSLARVTRHPTVRTGGRKSKSGPSCTLVTLGQLHWLAALGRPTHGKGSSQASVGHRAERAADAPRHTSTGARLDLARRI